jgi:hypothetical protein
MKVISKADTLNFTDVRSEIIVQLQAEHQQVVFSRFRDGIYKELGVRFVGAMMPIHLPSREERRHH